MMGLFLLGTFFVFMSAGLISLARAQDLPTIKITTGVAKGGYHTWSKEAAGLCADVVNLQVVESDGGPQNLDRLVDNEAGLGPMQVDTLLLNAQSGRDMGDIKVLIPLFPEQVHFIAKADLSVKTGGKFGTNIGATDTPITSVTQLAGLTVGAAGGAQDTMMYLLNFGRLGFQPFRLQGSSKDTVAAVLKGTIQVGVLTGASPIQWLKDMAPSDKAQLKFLSVPKEGLPGVNAYKMGQISYSGFGGNSPPSIPAFTVNSVLMTQNYRVGPKAQALASFKRCLIERGPGKAEEDGASKAWRFVKADAAVGTYTMWESPAAAQSPQPVPATKPVKK